MPREKTESEIFAEKDRRRIEARYAKLIDEAEDLCLMLNLTAADELNRISGVAHDDRADDIANCLTELRSTFRELRNRCSDLSVSISEALHDR